MDKPRRKAQEMYLEKRLIPGTLLVGGRTHCSDVTHKKNYAFWDIKGQQFGMLTEDRCWNFMRIILKMVISTKNKEDELHILSSDSETASEEVYNISKDKGNKRVAQKNGYLLIKRVLDVILSLLGLIICFVPIIVIMLLIKLESPGPAIYVHHRVGKNGKDLPLLKFRSMYINADEMILDFTPEQKAEWEENFKLNHDPRVTRVGHFLRRSSLDELPQLVNILKGELSAVGPRPVVLKELEKYGDNKDKFLSATPGLTGYWQAYARSTCSYEQRMEMELFYVDNANFWWDIKIMFATVGAVLRGYGAK